MDFYEAELAGRTEATRRCVVEEALRHVRARGVEPDPAVLALYARYVAGELSWDQVGAAMRQRREALAGQAAGAGKGPSRAPDPGPR